MLYRAFLISLLGLLCVGLGIAFAYWQKMDTTAEKPVFTDKHGCEIRMFHHEGRRVYYADCTPRMWR